MFHHTPGDDVISIGSGTLMSIVAIVCGWISASSFVLEAIGTIFIGLLGGAAGLVGKKGIEWIWKKRTRR